MRVALDARLNGYRDGGIAQYTRCLIDALAGLDYSGDYRVLFAARPRLRTHNLTPDSSFRCIPVYTPPHHKFERTALAFELLRLHVDVLHSPDFIPPRRVGKVARVITVHDLNFLLYPQFQTPDSLRYYAGNIRAAVREADHILAVSRSASDDLGNLLGVPAEKITVQPEGVTPDFRPLPVQEVQGTLRRLNLPATYLLFVGTLEPRKNLTGLLEAYHTLLGDSAVLPLVVVGQRGWLYEPIFEKAAELGLGEHVRWCENVTPADLPAVYNGAAALVLPSFYEGFGLPALEAMACGIPTVVSKRGALPEVVGDTGLMIDPDRPDSLVEALRCILTDSELRQRSSQSGLMRAAMFTWQRSAEIALSVYRLVSGC